jgi:hypothetical protein
MVESITVTGVDAVQRRLHGMSQRAGRQRSTYEAEARYAQRAVTGVPVATGRLERSVHGGTGTLREVNNLGYRIGSTVPYAHFVFDGTKSMPARPPHVPRDLGRRAADAVAADLARA